MLHPALAALPVMVISLVACSGSTESAASALLQPCSADVCGAPGSALTVRLTSFDHDTDVLDGAVGPSDVSFAVDATTQPLMAEPCEAASRMAGLITAWNATAPVALYGNFDLFDYDGDYHRLLVALAKAGAAASITLEPDMKTVQSLQPICAPNP
jgi:hypothetical protein